ncbi:GNAT family N-acetyltransferase [Bdellovibrio svalbardensis]|uniref:GNAT family N-acetyltransferase n=1 Tax=Bdellovibrio svalbardensis TaxID=2972972 RepID=A0ABT6DH28_9BACT|nr:GNAT family N-acetyltransferase [Bdellovibrio svalbardensis]MDG0815146.1 GNAT family N-acetyltransferase [Bdellovibrio svalbardensis]
MYQIRRAKPEDALGIHEAHMRSIQEVCSKDHTSEEVSAWGHRPFREDQRINAIKNQFVWVVESFAKIEGFGHMALSEKDGSIKAHVLGLYLVKEANGFGLGYKIVSAMIAEAKSRGAEEVTLESTLTAHKFYQKQGFEDSGPQGTINIGGVGIRYIPMRLIL